MTWEGIFAPWMLAVLFTDQLVVDLTGILLVAMLAAQWVVIWKLAGNLDQADKEKRDAVMALAKLQLAIEYAERTKLRGMGGAMIGADSSVKAVEMDDLRRRTAHVRFDE